MGKKGGQGFQIISPHKNVCLPTQDEEYWFYLPSKPFFSALQLLTLPSKAFSTPSNAQQTPILKLTPESPITPLSYL